MVRKLHGETARVRCVERPQPVSNLLHVDARRRRRRSRLDDVGRHLQRDGGIRPHILDGDVQCVEAVLLLDDVRRKLDAAIVGIVRIRDLDGHVADHGVRREVFDAIDEVLVVEGRLDVSSFDVERDDITVGGGAAGECRFDDAVRRQPHLTQAVADGARVGEPAGRRPPSRHVCR